MFVGSDGSQPFQSTLPLRGATRRKPPTHVPTTDFNPHSPCGERRLDYLRLFAAYVFQSTLPLRGATVVLVVFYGAFRISIHTPLAGSDCLSSILGAPCANFNPHSPCGERLIDGVNPLE